MSTRRWGKARYQENERTEQRRAQRAQQQIPKSEFVWQAQEQVMCARKTSADADQPGDVRRAEGGRWR